MEWSNLRLAFLKKMLVKSASVHKKTLSYLYGKFVKCEKIDTDVSRCFWQLGFGTTISRDNWKENLIKMQKR